MWTTENNKTEGDRYKMKTVVWGNYKGGVGKTTSTFQVAKYFSQKGKKVLLLDLDPQASLSNICCSPQYPLSSIKSENTVNFLFELYTRLIRSKPSFGFKMLAEPKHSTDVMPFISDVIKSVAPNLFFLPTSISYSNSRINDLAQKMASNLNNIFVIQLLINDLATSGFDYLFIDCPPTSNIITQSAFLTSDFYIVPTIVDEISANGVADYIAEIERTRQKFTLNEDLGGIVIERAFGEKSRLIGVFETIYKDRRGDSDNSGQIISLDRNIDSLSGISSLVSENQYINYRYRKSINGFETNNIFNSYIPHKDNRSGGESVALNTANGRLSESYEVISDYLLSMI